MFNACLSIGGTWRLPGGYLVVLAVIWRLSGGCWRLSGGYLAVMPVPGGYLAVIWCQHFC
eukprot:119783-Alexandrium_andersonii.AAC.1